ncbi:unnamed protein product [Dracunculus medinensis]|uniref:YqaE/Pmp3 family membrane protein n=1 Tax=Dracunculus medinensis TaxID=318479 RepID=A0A0N4U5P2_DRAME|nr:unnamed protein product [Dracunculus medinensis]
MKNNDEQVPFIDNRPIAVEANQCNIHVLINLFLMVFLILPAYIHAIWYCFFRKQPTNQIS